MLGGWLSNDRVARVQLKSTKEQCARLAVVDNGARILKSFDAGSVETWVHLLVSHPKWQEAAVVEPDLTVANVVVKHIFHEMDCVRVKDVKTKQEEEIQQQEGIGSWQEQEGSRRSCLPWWSEIFGGSKSQISSESQTRRAAQEGTIKSRRRRKHGQRFANRRSTSQRDTHVE